MDPHEYASCANVWQDQEVTFNTELYIIINILTNTYHVCCRLRTNSLLSINACKLMLCLFILEGFWVYKFYHSIDIVFHAWKKDGSLKLTNPEVDQLNIHHINLMNFWMLQISVLPYPSGFWHLYVSRTMECSKGKNWKKQKEKGHIYSAWGFTSGLLGKNVF